MRRRLLVWGGTAAVAAGLAFFATAAFVMRPAFLKSQIEQTLTKHLLLDVRLEGLTVSVFPRPQAYGTGLTLRIPNRPDLPPFISIDHFQVSLSTMAVLRKHVGTVHVGGLKIAVPPADVRRTAALSSNMPANAAAASKIIIDTFEAHDAQLTFSGSKPGKRPLEFGIQSLTVRDLGFERQMPYEATVINPIPRGLVVAKGHIGPWLPDDPTATALDGEFTFSDGDLSTINGIAGTVQSTGTFQGALTSIQVKGESRIPDFNLDLGGKPMALTASYTVEVVGTDGTTKLERVDAILGKSPMTVTGAITNLPGPGRHDVKLVADVADGRIEDLLALAIDAPAPMLTGDVRLHTTIDLPPGKARARDRISLAGRFGLGEARFTDAQVQEKMRDLSRRSQGKDKDDPMGRVMTSLRGEFVLKAGVLTMRSLNFQVPGATVALSGTYALDPQELDFAGTLRMDASASKALGGVKSIFVKPFDAMFRKNGKTELPIQITGQRTDPKFGLQIGKVMKR